jgi:hypothetical protein
MRRDGALGDVDIMSPYLYGDSLAYGVPELDHPVADC